MAPSLGFARSVLYNIVVVVWVGAAYAGFMWILVRPAYMPPISNETIRLAAAIGATREPAPNGRALDFNERVYHNTGPISGEPMHYIPVLLTRRDFYRVLAIAAVFGETFDRHVQNRSEWTERNDVCRGVAWIRTFMESSSQCAERAWAAAGQYDHSIDLVVWMPYQMIDFLMNNEWIAIDEKGLTFEKVKQRIDLRNALRGAVGCAVTGRDGQPQMLEPPSCKEGYLSRINFLSYESNTNRVCNKPDGWDIEAELRDYLRNVKEHMAGTRRPKH
jgi:hypothetical protein